MVMSALGPKADMCGATTNVCFGPIADIAQPTAASYYFILMPNRALSSLNTTAIASMIRMLGFALQ